MPLQLREEFMLLCEGMADQEFFRKLIEKRPGLPKFDVYPPNELHGSNAFGRMLTAIRGAGIGGFQRLKGVLIMADSTHDPVALFKLVCDQIRSAGGYGVPSRPLEVAAAANHPSVAVMLLPDENTPGALETLLAQHLEDKEPWITACVDQFLRCDKIEAHAWPAEKRDKARFHSMVAVLNRDDPSRAASYAFKDPAPLIALEASRFDDVEKRVKEFCTAVGV